MTTIHKIRFAFTRVPDCALTTAEVSLLINEPISTTALALCDFLAEGHVFADCQGKVVVWRARRD